jgi:hypothetical protein
MGLETCIVESSPTEAEDNYPGPHVCPYEDLSCLLRKHVTAPEFAARSVAAVLAGTTEAIFTPLERVQTLLQDHRHHDKFTNTYQAFRALKCHGIRVLSRLDAHSFP